jgi:hypothetical protein
MVLAKCTCTLVIQHQGPLRQRWQAQQHVRGCLAPAAEALLTCTLALVAQQSADQLPPGI